MNKLANCSAFLLALVFLLQACGPSQQEIEQREQATRDSLARVQAMNDQAAELAAQEQKEMEEQAEEEERRLAEAEAVQAEEEPAQEEHLPITFDDTGNYTIQVEAWRSKGKASASINKWKSRGFEQASAVEYGEAATGDVWFRIRLGRFKTHAMAVRQKENLASDFNIQAWIDQLER
ncbi:MAG: SPOR domain-containing protein [Balneolales bacterium]